MPLQSWLYHEPDLERELRQLKREHDLVLLQLVRLASHLSSLRDVPVIVDLIDSLALNFEQRARFDTWPLSWLWRWEAARLAHWERIVLESVERCWLVCERDSRAVAARSSQRASVGVVPIAVEPSTSPASDGAAHDPEIILTGNLGYFPNRDAVRWFVRRVWPRLSQSEPTLWLRIAGSRPPRSLERVLRASGRCRLDVRPQSLRALIARATVALAPLRAGSGVPIKVLESWAEGRAVAASPWAASGTTAVDGREVLVLDQPQEWIDGLRLLLADKERRELLGRNGRLCLERHYSKDRVAEQLADELTLL